MFEEDGIDTFAARHYKNEIWMLSNFDILLESGLIIQDLGSAAKPTKRMPINIESNMVQNFETYKKAHAIG